MAQSPKTSQCGAYTIEPGVTTIQEDSAACKVLTSRVTVEVEAAMHVLG